MPPSQVVIENEKLTDNTPWLGTNLPVDLLAWVAKDRVIKFSVLKTYLYIKMTYPDHFKISSDLHKEVAYGLNIDVKTAKDHINQLLQVKFMGFDKNTGTIWVWSKYKIIPKSKRNSKYVIKISFSDLDHFTEFVLTSAVAYMVRKQRQIAKYRPALKNDGAFRSRYKVILKWYTGYPISLTYISAFLGKSVSWVDKYKKKAMKLKWLTAHHSYERTDIKWQERFAYMKNHRINVGRAKKFRGMLFLTGTDILTSAIYIKKRKKSV